MRFGFAVLAGVLAMPGLALAQTDSMAMAHESAANQLGVLEYCQSKGYTDGSAVVAQQGVISRLPAYAGSTAAAEATGKTGVMAPGNGQTYSLSDMADKSHTTEAALCAHMADSTKQVAASNASAFGPGGMPKMPAMPGGMPAMPAMPGGMPTMPGVPQPQ